ncbi:Mismatch repair protein msh3 [Chamberlinius hualienensis]
MEKLVTCAYFTKTNEKYQSADEDEVQPSSSQEICSQAILKRKRLSVDTKIESDKRKIACNSKQIHPKLIDEEFDINSDVSNLTALEKQFIKLKADNPDVVLLIETGYLFRLFREDADVAKKELRFKLSAGHNLVTTSFPFQTLPIHIRHLAGKGYKVGVVRKTESSLMKAAGPGPNDIFNREITALYTNSTLVGEDVDISFSNVQTKSHYNEAASYLMSVYELPISSLTVRIGVVAVCLLSGDFVFDHFTDDENRCSFQSCFQRVNPAEILLPNFSISDETLNFIHSSRIINGHTGYLRIEQVDDDNFRLENVDTFLRDFYIDLECHLYSTGAEELINYVMNLPPPVICALRALMSYLKGFKLEYIFTLIKQMRLISSKLDSIPLDSKTICSLELLRCNRSTSFEGCLLHLMDHTFTPWGSRLLRSWMCHPLKCIDQINNRLDAVDWLVNHDYDFITLFKKMISSFSDLENGIMLIYNKRSSPKLYWKTITSFLQMRNLIITNKHGIETTITNSYLKELLLNIINLTEDVDDLLTNLNSEAACQGSKSSLFKDDSSYPNLLMAAEEIEKVKFMLDECLNELAPFIDSHKMTFGSFYEKKYVVIVKTSSEHLIPSDWLIVARNVNKICCRTSEMEILIRRLKLLDDHYKYQCHLVWMEYLKNFKQFYFQLRHTVANLATIDCLMSMAIVSKAQTFSKPIVISGKERTIIVRNGFHPTVSQMLEPGKEFVRNDVILQTSKKSCMIISGANMGGKSVYVKQIALITLMAQMGCFVPADYACFTPVDAIYLRSGVKDNLVQRKSAFYVEAEAMANILNLATCNSLILIDEFGRCTSDSDSVNLACSIVDFIITKLQCLALVVISQFSDIAKLREIHPNKVACYHMDVIASTVGHESASLIDRYHLAYLYKLSRGVADESYAIHVAKMAGLDSDILHSSIKKAKEMEETKNNLKSTVKLFQQLFIESFAKENHVRLCQILENV